MKLFQKISSWIANLIHRAHADLEELLPIAIQVVESFKKIDDAFGDPLAALIGGLAPAVQAKIKSILPKVLFELRLVTEFENMSTEDGIKAALSHLLAELHGSSELGKQKLLTDLAAMILHQLQDGELSWAEAVIDVEYWYQNQHK